MYARIAGVIDGQIVLGTAKSGNGFPIKFGFRPKFSCRQGTLLKKNTGICRFKPADNAILFGEQSEFFGALFPYPTTEIKCVNCLASYLELMLL